MKQLLRSLAITACVALSFAGAQAQVITAERAQEIANSFFSNGKQKSAAVRSTAAVSMKKSADSRILTSESSSDAPTFHIITPASGEGFVIVAGEEMENPIIGYSFEGTIDTNDLPVGFVDYMTDIDAQVKALRKYNANKPQKAAAARSAIQKTNYAATTMGNIVVRIETAKWGQDAPFNQQCYTSTGATAKTGCVPTAYAIIMRHHQWPLEGIGNLYWQTAGTSNELITDRTYDWENMPLVYDNNATDYQKNEVAKVMRDLGQAYMVTYGTSETGVSVPGNTEKLKTYFDYNIVYGTSQAEVSNIEDWKERIRNSLDNNCPIPYKSHNVGSGDTNHIFVVDGYTDTDYFHFNFGWYGGSNGWYRLESLAPSGSDYTWSNTSDHLAIFNLTPNRTYYAISATPNNATYGTTTIKNSTGTVISDANGIASVIEGATVTLAATANTGYTFSNWTKGGEIVSTAKSFTVNVTEAADYVANFLEISTTEEVNINITSNAGGTVKINGTTTNSTSVAKNSSVTVTALPENGYIFSNWTDGTEEITTAEYTFVATGNKELTATFAVAPYYTITAEATAGGTATVNGSSTYSAQQNNTATLQAIPNDGYNFIKWTVNGSEVSTQNPLEISIQGDKTYTANFANTQVTIKQSGSGGYMYIGTGTVVNTNTEVSTRSKTVNAGEKIYLRAEPSTKEFGYWRLGSSNGPIVTNDNPYFFTAKESATFFMVLVEAGNNNPVAVSAAATAGGSATITIDDNAVTQAPLGEEVTLKAMPTAGYRFVKWTTGSGTEEQVISTEATCTAIVQAATTYTANFEVIEGGTTPPATTTYTITATANPGTAGSVTGGGTYNEGATVTLTATPNSGYEFVNWTKDGAQVSTSATYSFTANATAEYVAHFQTAAATTFAVTTTANPIEGGTATFAEGTGQATTSASVASGTQVTLNAVANTGYRFVNWTNGTSTISSEATANVTINANSNFVANFEPEGAATEYPIPTGDTYTDNYLTSITTTGGDTNIGYSANSHPGQKLVVVPGKVQLEKGKSFTMSLIAKSLGAGSSSIKREDMRYCHASLFTDFDQNFTFEASPVETWGNQPPTNNVYGNYDYVMNITHTITVPDDAPIGESHVRMIYTNAWKEWPANGTAELDKGIVYDIVVEVVEKVDITANAGAGGSVTINGEATGTKRVIKGSEVTLAASANDGYSFAGWYDGGTLISTDNPYTFTANSATTLTAYIEPELPITGTDLDVTFDGANWTRYDGSDIGENTWIFKTVTTTTPAITIKVDGNVNNLGFKEIESVKHPYLYKGTNFIITVPEPYKIAGYKLTVVGDNFNEGTFTYTVGTQNAAAAMRNAASARSNTATATIEGTTPTTVIATGLNTSEVNIEVGSATEATAGIVITALEIDYVEQTSCTVNVNANPGTAGTATVATGTDPGSSSIEVEPETSVTLTATPADGYVFANWTNNLNTDVVTDNPYTITVTADVTYTANFDKKYINITLTDKTNSNNQNPFVFNFVLNDLEGEVTKATIATKLMEKYPVIMSLGAAENATLTDNGTSYTYTNTVALPFEIGNGKEDDAVIWYNIYYSNIENRPNYLSASSNETTLVEKINDENYPYGDNPVYNTEKGNDPISWAIYSVNNSLEFMLKNKVSGKFIQVTSVANNDAQNAVYVDEAYATAFHFIRKTEDFINYFAFAAKIGENTGYLCSTSSDYGWATHYNSYDQAGGWARIEDPGYFSRYVDLNYGLIKWFAPGNGYSIVTTEIQNIKDALENYENITLNTFVKYGIILADSENWPTIKLNIAPENSGATSINGEEGVTTKRAPVGHEFPIAATPAAGYHFVNWTKGTDEPITSAEHTIAISGAKGEVTELTANFAINIYTVNVTAEANGSASASAATVEHGSEVTLTATPSTGYSFAGWYDGENLISAEASYTFTVTSHINYTARFNEVPTGTVAIHITVASTDDTTVTNAVDGNVKAIINNIGQEWATGADFVVGADVELVATNDYDQKAYLFDGWYKNGVLVSNDLEITVQATEVATYEARFFRGCVVIGNSNNNQFGYVSSITLADGTSIGYDASNRAVVKAGTTVKINTFINMYGYEVGSWTNANDEIVSTDKDFIVEVNEDVTYTANFEPASYNLTVRANDDSYGTVSATSGTSTGTTVKVGQNMEATITATANTGYYFVNWTKGTDVVSSENPYTIAGIANVEDMADAEYIANFLPVENATAGVYYRIGYDGFAAAASAGAARAAGSTQTITLLETGELGGIKSNSKNSEWNSDYLSMHATGGNSGNPVYAIYKSGTSYFRLFGYTNDANANTYNNIKYTLTAKEGYIITGCSFSYTQKIAGAVTINYNGASENSNDVSSHDWAITPNAQTVEITLSTTTNNSSNYLTVKNFTVTIQQVGEGEGSGGEGEGGETPANRYYMQSVASNVSGKANALLMTQDTGASSIFYYADSKLLSYDKGTYVKEDGGTRGLQAVGESGTVTITTSGETATIAAPSYLRAVDGTTRYVDHCGSNPDNHAANHNFVLEEVTTLPVTISSALHATFYAPVAVAIPEGVKAYVLKAENIPGIETYAWMTSLKNGIIPANTGVIIKGAEGTYYFDIVENNDAARTEAVGNVLSGTVAKTKITEDAYILANREGKVGLYPVAKNSYLDTNTIATTVRFTNNSHKAYLPVTNDWFGEKLKMGTGFRFVYDDEETTGIDEFETENTETIYDLQGRKLSEITEPGIYIVGGKKVWVK